MKYTKWIIVLQLLIIVVLTGFLIKAENKPTPRMNDRSYILTHFDQLDLNRTQEMIHRFREGIGDNLMMISPTIDSGPEIHDMYSDGKELHWIVDNTRDGMSTNTGKTAYVCKGIQLDELVDRYRVELTSCVNRPSDEKIGTVVFWKENL